MNFEYYLCDKYSTGDCEIECIAGEGRDIVNCNPGQWTSLNGAEVVVVDEYCNQICRLFADIAAADDGRRPECCSGSEAEDALHSRS